MNEKDILKEILEYWESVLKTVEDAACRYADETGMDPDELLEASRFIRKIIVRTDTELNKLENAELKTASTGG